MPALHRRNVPNCRPMADGGMRKCSAVEDFARRGACPPLGSGWGEWQNPPCQFSMCTKPQLRLFIVLVCRRHRHEQFAMAHHGIRSGMCPPINLDAGSPRNVPNCRPMVDGGMKKCSAGACPPLGSGWGVALTDSCTKPIFHPLCRLCPPINLDAGSPPAKRAEL